jgi:hypothetical protein
MQRIVLRSIVIFALAFAALSGNAKPQWVERAQLIADPADPAVIRFSIDVREPGSYQVRLLARGESKQEIQLDLLLQQEAGGPARTVHFAFTGAGCG